MLVGLSSSEKMETQHYGMPGELQLETDVAILKVLKKEGIFGPVLILIL